MNGNYIGRAFVMLEIEDYDACERAALAVVSTDAIGACRTWIPCKYTPSHGVGAVCGPNEGGFGLRLRVGALTQRWFGRRTLPINSLIGAVGLFRVLQAIAHGR